MKRFNQIFNEGKKVLSLEFFPPKKEESLPVTEALMKELAFYNPDFMTVTYGAGGGTKGYSKRLVSYIRNTLKIPSVAHLTCVGHSRDELMDIVNALKDEGVAHILALRGDPPIGQDSFTMHPEGFACARDLAQFLRGIGGLSLAVAGYPEVHQDAKSPDDDIAYLKSKVDAGAEVIITQLFFDPEVYFSFCEKASDAGIKIPIVPGIMPIQNVSQLERFTGMCGASIPSDLHADLKKIKDNSDAVVEFGTKYAINQIKILLKGGAPGVHLYTLNKSMQVISILDAIQDDLAASGSTNVGTHPQAQEARA